MKHNDMKRIAIKVYAVISFTFLFAVPATDSILWQVGYLAIVLANLAVASYLVKPYLKELKSDGRTIQDI